MTDLIIEGLEKPVVQYKLVPPNDPILYEQMPEWDFNASHDLTSVKLYQLLGSEMVRSMGIGLSANQLGIKERMFVMRAQNIIGCINPIIVDASTKTVKLEEGCLSFPKLIIPVVRPKTIKVRFMDPAGEVHTEIYDGMTARIFQHELDHLNGRCFITKASQFTLSKAITSANKKGAKYKLSDINIMVKKIQQQQQ